MSRKTREEIACDLTEAVSSITEDSWHDRNRTACIVVAADGQRRAMAVRSAAFHDLVGRLYFEKTKQGISVWMLHRVMREVEARALFDGACHDADCATSECVEVGGGRWK